MTEEQEKAYGKFARLALNKDVPMYVALIVASVFLESEDWRATLDDIVDLLNDCKDADEFEIRLRAQYPRKEVVQPDE